MDSARISLYPLSFVSEGDEVVVGRAETESYAVFPADAARVVQQLRDGASVGQAAAWYAEEYGETADVADLVETLRELGFVREEAAPGDQSAGVPAAPAPAARDATRFRPLARLMFSPGAWVLYGAVIGLCCYVLVRDPWLRPLPSRIVFDHSLLMLFLVWCCRQVVGIAWHESFHVMAARRLGVPARLSVGRRLYFLVFQTTLTGLMGVPRGKRVLPFCAGLLADALFGSVLTGVAWACHGHGGAASAVSGAAATAVYLTALRMSWQFLVFMETDLYYVLVHLLRMPDLHGLSRTYLRNRWWLVRRPARVVDQSGLGAREQTIVRRYAPVVLVCGIAMTAMMLTFAVPAVGALFHTFSTGISSWSVTDPHWWDSFLALLLVLLEPTLVATLARASTCVPDAPLIPPSGSTRSGPKEGETRERPVRTSVGHRRHPRGAQRSAAGAAPGRRGGLPSAPLRPLHRCRVDAARAAAAARGVGRGRGGAAPQGGPGGGAGADRPAGDGAGESHRERPGAGAHRWFPASTTQRQSQGLIDLLRELTAPEGPGRPLTLAFDSVHEADPTDLEFLSLALRRLDPSRVRLVVGASGGDWPAELAQARARYAGEMLVAAPLYVRRVDPAEAARAFVASDGTSDDRALIAGYAACDPAARTALHDERARQLELEGLRSARYGRCPGTGCTAAARRRR
ncbi:hypothetical protein GXW82_04040 [Streptacidiphilus sp. 4-A2]|nr:hypothetical protein [Streptacidiphilus sp. 4-A2]